MSIAIGLVAALLLGWGGFLFADGIALLLQRRFGKGLLYVLALPLLAVVALLLAALLGSWSAADPTERARALAEGLSAAMNCGPVGALLGALWAIIRRLRGS